MSTVPGNIVEAHFFLDPEINTDSIESFRAACFQQALAGIPLKFIVRFLDEGGLVTRLTQLLAAEKKWLEKAEGMFFSTGGWQRRFFDWLHALFLQAKLVTAVWCGRLVIDRLRRIALSGEIALEHHFLSFHIVPREATSVLLELVQQSTAVSLIIFEHDDNLFVVGKFVTAALWLSFNNQSEYLKERTHAN